jgi:hypothetical protein
MVSESATTGRQERGKNFLINAGEVLPEVAPTFIVKHAQRIGEHVVATQ